MTPSDQVRTPGLWRLRGRSGRFAAAAIAAVMLASCVQPATRAVEVRHVAGADEPEAANVGRRILETGGTAADAAVAMALTMAVTMPSRVGLGGGGACLVHDGSTGAVEEFEFLPEALPGGRAGEPGLVVGLFALHAAHGNLRWAQLVAEAENRARFGFQVSQGLVEDSRTAGVQPPIRLEAGTLAPGARALAPAMADSLAIVRERGARAMMEGPLADRYAAALGYGSAVAAGLPGAVPQRNEALAETFGRDFIYVAPSPQSNGPAVFEAWRQGGSGTVGQALPTANLVALSTNELGVVCSFTLNGLFGTGVAAGDTGILPARPVPPGQPMIGGLAMWANEPLTQILYAGTASAGPVGVVAPLRAFAQGGQPLDAAMTTATGTNALAIGCQWDRSVDKFCDARTDPQGRGSASVFEFGPGVLERLGGTSLIDFRL